MHITKKSITNITKSIIFITLFIMLFTFLSTVFTYVSNTSEDGMENRISRAYRGEEKDSIDIMLLGNSDIYRGFSPVDLYHKTKITSAISGQPGATIDKVYESAKDILKYQKPKMIVLETDCMFSDKDLEHEKKAESNEKTKKPVSDTVLDMLSFFRKLQNAAKNGDNIILSAVNYYFPLIKYHDNWNKLTFSSFTKPSDSFYKFSNKGMAYSSDVKPFDASIDYMKKNYGGKAKLTSKTSDIFDDIYKLCKENDIELVLITVPSANSWNNGKSAEIQKLAKKYDLKYYDYNKKYPDGFDWNHHTNDGGNHLNYAGALTVTNDFGSKLKNEIKIPESSLTKDQQLEWEKDYSDFHEKINQNR